MMTVIVTITMSAMAMVHENVHQRTRQQQQKRQRTKEVGAMFAQEKVCGDGAHDEEPEGIASPPEVDGLAFMRCGVLMHIIL